MSEHPKDVVRRFYDIINGGALERLDEVCSPDLRGHAGAGSDLAELKQAIGSLLESFPGVRTEPRHLVCEGDVVSAWVTYEGAHRGMFAGIAGTGRPVKFAAWDLFKVEHGRIVEITQFCDVFTLMNQIGALPTSTPA